MPDPIALKEQLQRELDQPWVACACHTAEIHAVGNVAIHFAELRVIDNIEEFRAEFEPHLLMNDRVLVQGEIEIVDAGPAADRSRRTADGSHGLRLKGVLRERVVARRARIQPLEWLHHVRLTRQLKIVTVHQLQIIGRSDPNRKPVLKSENAGSAPAIQQFSGGAGEVEMRQLVVVAKYKPLARIKHRERAAAAVIQRIEDVLEAGRVVDRFAESVSALERKPLREPLLDVRLE